MSSPSFPKTLSRVLVAVAFVIAMLTFHSPSPVRLLVFSAAVVSALGVHVIDRHLFSRRSSLEDRD